MSYFLFLLYLMFGFGYVLRYAKEPWYKFAALWFFWVVLAGYEFGLTRRAPDAGDESQ